MASSPKKEPAVTYVLPIGTAAFPHVEIPDTEGQFASNRFTIQMVWEPDVDLSTIKAAIVKGAKEKFGTDYDEDTFKFPFRVVDEDAKKEEFRGKVMAQAKSKFQPQVVDAKRNPIKITPYDMDNPPANPKRTLKMAGDKVRIMVTLYFYAKDEEETIVEKGKRTKVKVKVFGCSLQLVAIQIVEKRSGSGGNYAGGFGEIEDGYDSSAQSGFADESDGAAGTDGSSNGDY